MLSVEVHALAFVVIGFAKMLERLVVVFAVIEHLAEREVQVDSPLFGNVRLLQEALEAGYFRQVGLAETPRPRHVQG